MSKKISEMEVLTIIKGEKVIPVVINEENKSIKPILLRGKDGDKGEAGASGKESINGKDSSDEFVREEIYNKSIERVSNLEAKVIITEETTEKTAE